MFERFTDHARMVMAIANQEAQRFNHEYIGTEHILLGLIKDGAGVGAAVLKDLGIDPATVIIEVEKLTRVGPEMVSMGRLPLTPRAKKVVEYAIEEARDMGHQHIGTEHLLLGLLREHDGIAAQVLMSLDGITVPTVKEKILDTLERDKITDYSSPVSSDLSQTAGTRDVSEFVELFNLKLDDEQKTRLTKFVSGQPAIEIDCPFSDPKFLKPAIEHAAANNPIEYLKALPRPLAKFIIDLCQSDEFPNAGAGFKSIMPEAVFKSLFPEVGGERDYRPFLKWAWALQQHTK